MTFTEMKTRMVAVPAPCSALNTSVITVAATVVKDIPCSFIKQITRQETGGRLCYCGAGGQHKDKRHTGFHGKTFMF